MQIGPHVPLLPSVLICTLALAPLGAATAATASNVVCSGCVGSTDLANGAVTAAKLGSNSVDSSKIRDGSIANRDLGNSSVTGYKIKDGSVASRDLATSSVTSIKIKDGSVANRDLATNSVTSIKIRDGSIYHADLAANSVDSGNIADGSIGAADLHASLLARIEALEAALGVQPQTGYSEATFQGTYRCMTNETEASGRSDDSTGEGYTGVGIGTHSMVLTSEGTGTVNASGTDTWYWRSWHVAWYEDGNGWHPYLGEYEETPVTDDWGPEYASYTVSTGGGIQIVFPGDEEQDVFDGWISQDGDTVVFGHMGPIVDDQAGETRGEEVDLSICVRTDRSAGQD